MSKTKSIVIIVVLSLIIAVMGVACFLSFPIPGTVKDYNSIMSLIGKGIDLSGGYYVVLTPESVDESDDSVLDSAMTVLRTRLDNKGYTEATISLQDGDKIRVEVPEVENASDVLSIIGSSGGLSFRDNTIESGGQELMSGENITSAYVGYDNNSGGYVCVINFNERGVTEFSNATYQVLNDDNTDTNILYIYLGDDLISQPTVNEQITSRSAQIDGFDSYESADAVASVIESGKLPISYTISESRTIGATLGESAMSFCVIAAAIGLALIFILLIVFYRGMGVAASLALIIYTLLFIVFLAIIPSVQLTLPGLAGILLSIGMAVDANIVIFERIKDEYRQGKTVVASIKAGFNRAVVTVIDSNVTTILASIVLLILCPGSIKGFAITLLIGIVISMFTAIFVTRWLIKLFMPLSENKEKMFRLKRGEEVANV